MAGQSIHYSRACHNQTRTNIAMNKERASTLLLGELEKLKSVPYEQLKTLVLRDEPDSYVIVDEDTKYEIKIFYRWDSGKPGNIRVVGNINVAGGWSAYRPHSEDFIVRSDGSLVE
jgi:hypothetical protein